MSKWARLLPTTSLPPPPAKTRWRSIVSRAAEEAPRRSTMTYDDNPALHRCRYRNDFPHLGVFGRPLTFVIDCFRHVATLDWLATDMTRIFSHLTTHPDAQHRTFEILKYLTDEAEKMEDEDPSIAMILMGLERCTPPKIVDKLEVIQDTQSWVSVKKTWGTPIRKWINAQLSMIEATWKASVRHAEVQRPSWRVFRNDPLRWGTTGGGPRSQWTETSEVKVRRTKWAWALAQLRDGRDIYEAAQELPHVAHVAFKQEPTKTRLVITTPMASYLRQSYIMECAGVCPELQSPISDVSILKTTIARTWKYYVSVDARTFDHQIPSWMVKEAILMAARVGGRYRIGVEEVNSLDSLRVECLGKLTRWRGGVLSGWRMTSYIGTLASELFCRRVKEDARFPVEYIVQGDDVLLFANEPLSTTVAQVAKMFNLQLKATPRDSPTGMFLQKTIGQDYQHAAFGRAVRQLFYANPWLDRYQFPNPHSIAGSWLQVMSRLPGTDHREWLIHQAASDMARWARAPGWNSKVWYELLTTDSGLGGLGTWDTHQSRDMVPEIRTRAVTVKHKGAWETLLGIVAPQMAETSSQWMKRTWRAKYHPKAPVSLPVTEINPIIWDVDTNKTVVLVSVLQNGIKKLPGTVRRAIPHWLRGHPPSEVVRWLLTPSDLPALRHTCFPPYITSSLDRAWQFMAGSYLRTRRGGVLSLSRALYSRFCDMVQGRVLPLGMW